MPVLEVIHEVICHRRRGQSFKLDMIDDYFTLDVDQVCRWYKCMLMKCDGTHGHEERKIEFEMPNWQVLGMGVLSFRFLYQHEADLCSPSFWQ